MTITGKIRKLDVFPKIPTELSQPTNIGGLISIITASFILIFFIYELDNYLHPEYQAQISLQKKLVTRQQMNINLDISFPRFPCELIALDLEDVMISHHPNIGSVQKWRIDQNGDYVDKRPFQLLSQENPFRQIQLVRTAFQRGYGCRLIGSFTVKEVPGNFHISCHSYMNQYMQSKMQGLFKQLDMSHHIHKLYFGRENHLQAIKSKHPEASLHLLQNKTVEEGISKSIHYHIDIVPTWYHESIVNNYYTYQYTYKENPYYNYQQPPALHFNYAIGGLTVEILPKSQDFFVFITHLCAVIGGTYALAQVIHNFFCKFTSKFEYQLVQ